MSQAGKWRLAAFGSTVAATLLLSYDPTARTLEPGFLGLFAVLSVIGWGLWARLTSEGGKIRALRRPLSKQARKRATAALAVTVGVFVYVAAGRPTPSGFSSSEQVGAAMANLTDSTLNDFLRQVWAMLTQALSG